MTIARLLRCAASFRSSNASALAGSRVELDARVALRGGDL
jgi:hypothetical protein